MKNLIGSLDAYGAGSVSHISAIRRADSTVHEIRVKSQWSTNCDMDCSTALRLLSEITAIEHCISSPPAIATRGTQFRDSADGGCGMRKEVEICEPTPAVGPFLMKKNNSGDRQQLAVLLQAPIASEYYCSISVLILTVDASIHHATV